VGAEVARVGKVEISYLQLDPTASLGQLIIFVLPSDLRLSLLSGGTQILFHQIFLFCKFFS
jgi:hypothetical protein